MCLSCGLRPAQGMPQETQYLTAAFSLAILDKSCNAKIQVRHWRSSTKVILKGILGWYPNQ